MDFTKKISMMKEKRKELDKFISSTYISKSLKFFTDDILFLIGNNFSIKEQKEILEEVFEFEINYQTYASFYNRNIKSKIGSNKNVKSENNKNGSEDKKVGPNEDIKSSNETNIKNDKKIVSKKDTNVNEEETFSLFDDNSIIVGSKEESSIKKSNIKIVEDDITSVLNNMNLKIKK